MISATVTVTGDFNEKWAEFEKYVGELPGLLKRELGSEMREALATRTPVKTGRAAGSWNASLNAPNLSVQPEGYMNPGGAYLDGESDLEGAGEGDVVYITNAIPYLAELNEGSSTQAPAGFIEAELASAHDRIMAIVERLKRT